MVTQEEMEQMSPEQIRELQKQNCPFCKIVKGEIPTNKVYEDEHVLAITDINPATKGHLLILPKEHYPILPLVPPETFDKLFQATKLLSQAVKQAVLADSTTVFIANGGVAGQQSPHFLFHLIPRSKGDNLNNFVIEGKGVDQQGIVNPLKHNLPIMMANQVKQRGKVPETPPQAAPTQEQLDQKRAMIAKILEENADVRNLLRSDPQEFRNTIQQNEELTNIFAGVDIDALSNHLKQQPEPQQQTTTQPQQENQQLEQPQEHSVTSYTNQASPSPDQPTHNLQNTESSPQPRPEVFLGADPYKQKEAVFAYFEQKPKAKELLMTETEKFKELLATRPDVQPIFENVNIDKLAQKLLEAEGRGVQQ